MSEEFASKAKGRYLRGSPDKMRLMVDAIRGKDVEEALDILQLSKKRASEHVEKVLRSAIANAENVDPEVDVDRLYIAETYVNQGPSLPRRIRPRAMGRAYPIIKRTSHVTVKLGTRDEG